MSEERLNQIEGRLEKIDERLGGIENTLVTVTKNMNAMREDIYLLRQ